MNNQDIEFSHPIFINDIGVKKQQIDLEATPEECEKLAKRFNLLGINRLKAKIKIKKNSKDSIVLEGMIGAEVIYQCVITLEEFCSEIRDDFKIIYDLAKKSKASLDKEEDISFDEVDYEFLDSNFIDLGEVCAEQLGLNLELYPSKEGAKFEYEIEKADEDNNPFTALKRNELK